MPFRFRRTFKIAPGLRIHLSKGGVSTSIGTHGASVNFGKKGIRQTIGIPGTGLSHTQTIFKSPDREISSINSDDHIAADSLPIQSAPLNDPGLKITLPKRLTNFWSSGREGKIILSIFILLAACLCSIPVIGMLAEDVTPTPTVTATSITRNIEILPPIQPLVPTITYTPLSLPTSIKTITTTLIITTTPILVKSSTPQAVTQKPTSTSSGTCSCSGDLYNCSNFSTQKQAQACYDFCFSITGRDIHDLDGNDNDGKVCESLP